MPEQSVFQALMDVIAQRRDHPPEGRSYVVTLLNGGIPAIGAKLTEEAGEVVEAAAETGAEGRAHLIHEIADLLFHTMVLMGHQRIGIEDIENELARRFGIGGHAEKESRPAPRSG